MNLKRYPGLNPENVEPEPHPLQDISEMSDLKPDLEPISILCVVEKYCLSLVEKLVF